jgi:hypothetical protein
MAEYADDMRASAELLARRWAIELENYAKNRAPWEDRTGNARQSLYSVVHTGNGQIIIYLSHGVDYGVWLELRHQGQYAIIMRTLEHHYQQIQDSYRRTFN